MSTSLVFGASGAIGRFLLPRLAGTRVFAVSRRKRRGGDVDWIVAALDAGFDVPAPLDAIYSCGPLDAFARWYECTPTGAARVVAIGSMSASSKRDSTDASERDVSARLRAAEDAVLRIAAARGAVATVLRPTLIYGTGRDRSLAPIARFAQRWRVCPRILGARGLRQPVHADDLAAACVAVAASPRAAGRCYEVGGGERLSFAAMIERTCRSLDVRLLTLPLPLFALGGAAQVAAALGRGTPQPAAVARLREDLIADNGDAARDFGWSPRPFRPDAARWPLPDESSAVPPRAPD